MNELKSILNTCLQEYELNQIEIGPLSIPLTIDFYEKWLQKNYYGDMVYLKEHFEFKKNPQKLSSFPNKPLQSVISIAQSYFPLTKPLGKKNSARIATYAQNEDYHYWLKQKLNQIIDKLKLNYPDESFLPYVDSGPLLERNWAYQNGLGWFGKNTCLIHPKKGSLFFIAEILTSLGDSTIETINEANNTPLDIVSMVPMPDLCGKCQKCIEICPTNALVAPQILKADQCVSYLTIESKTIPSVELRPLMGDWFFGCDLCQTVCPWNQKIFKAQNIKSNDTSTLRELELTDDEKEELIKYFKWLLTTSHKQIQKANAGSALSRASAKNLKRNALIVIANRKLLELKDQVELLKNSELIELKEWTLKQLSS